MGGMGLPRLLFCLSLLIGFLVAHYRDALQIPLEELSPNQTAERIALQTFLENPFGLSDIYSWMLLLLTLVFGILACFDGYRFDDPYPGFSSIAKSTTNRQQFGRMLLKTCDSA